MLWLYINFDIAWFQVFNHNIMSMVGHKFKGIPEAYSQGGFEGFDQTRKNHVDYLLLLFASKRRRFYSIRNYFLSVPSKHTRGRSRGWGGAGGPPSLPPFHKLPWVSGWTPPPPPPPPAGLLPLKIPGSAAYAQVSL